ncbi:hypothetical protein CDAR_42171 [Caerostris darwini]|uniref:Uncharacterized protein n=1 Tax=Caerostris darwini TaxID=1538125 RepID=A0AAV4RJ70_9ARAC|nr:hypothetical protein CDAR_42171 [Caerostris darwini]
MVTSRGLTTWDPNGGPGRPRLTPGRAGGRNISIKALFFSNMLPLMCGLRSQGVSEEKKKKKKTVCRVLMGVLKKKFVFFSLLATGVASQAIEAENCMGIPSPPPAC